MLFESYNCRRWWKPGLIAVAIGEIAQHYLGLLRATLYWCDCISFCFRWRLATQAIPTITSCPMQRWKSCTNITGKLWGFSFPSTRTNLLVGGKSKIPKKGTDEREEMELLSQRFYNYLAGSTDFGNVSFKIPGIHPFFYIGTDARNHTEEYTEAAGTPARLRRGMNMLLLPLMKVNCIRCFKPSSCFQVTWFVCLVFYLPHIPSAGVLFPSTPGAEKAQVFTLRTAKALAMTVVDVVCCPALLQQVKEDFRLAKLKMENWVKGSDTAWAVPRKTTTFIALMRQQ